MATTIVKTMLISEILELVPPSVDVMLDSGLHCVGCSANSMESLEDGMKGHGFTDEEIDALVKKINDLQTETEEEAKPVPTYADYKAEKIEEGNKIYYKLAGMMFTKQAYDSLHELKTDRGLQIRLDAGGCAGYSLKYDFFPNSQPDEKIYTLSEDLKLFINDFTFEKLHGAIVNYESGLHGSGLTFKNINKTKSCSCGTSFNF